ncbi:MAG: DUF1043 family protein [Marinagarivorans sp.]|nr:DUF1043 family protein [Marinagarivorans sp.]
MISTTALVATCLVCLIAGAGLGALIMRAVIAKQIPKDLQSKYNALQAEHQQYQQDVAQHFVDSSRLILETQQRQKELRQHMVTGALNLTSADVSRAILALGDDDKAALDNDALIDPSNLIPPKDWAPKTPGQNGVLSEEFGLKEEREEHDNIEAKTANPKFYQS